jgi:hypothetical protein
VNLSLDVTAGDDQGDRALPPVAGRDGRRQPGELQHHRDEGCGVTLEERQELRQRDANEDRVTDGHRGHGSRLPGHEAGLADESITSDLAHDAGRPARCARQQPDPPGDHQIARVGWIALTEQHLAGEEPDPLGGLFDLIE